MKNKDLLFKVLSLLKPYKLRIFIAIISLLTVVACLLTIGNIIKHFVDSNLDPFGSSFKFLTSLIILFGLASFLRSYLINSTAEFAANDAKKHAFSALLLMDSSEIDKYSYSDLSSRINSDSEYVSRVVIDATSFFVRNILTSVGGIIFMFLNSVSLSAISFIVIGSITFVITRLSRKIRNLAKKTEEAKSKTTNLILESIINNKVIQAFQTKSYILHHFHNLNNDVIFKTSERLRFRSILFASAITSMLLTISGIIWYGSIQVSNNAISSGTLASFLFYTFMTAMSFGGIIEMLSEFEKNLANCERLFEISNISSRGESRIIKVDQTKEIEFNKINYSYKDNETSVVLNNFSLKIKLGNFSVITGQSGSGKTTILNLIMGIYRPKSGSFEISGEKFNYLHPEFWGNNLSYVPQDNMLFSGTVAENISMFESNPDIQKIQQILENLDMSDFIKSLSKGYNTDIGSLASKISGGQRQRIAIARALYKDPEILILDESTSQLDEETESHVIEYIKSYMKGKTIICVAHRRGAIDKAEIVIPI